MLHQSLILVLDLNTIQLFPAKVNFRIRFSQHYTHRGDGDG